MMRTILSTTKIKKKYDLTVALQGVSIDVKANEFVAVLGKSGSGKSTLFHIIDGLLMPDEGEIIIDGNNILKMKKKEFVTFRRLNVGYVFQDFKLIPEISVIDNILFPVNLDCEKIDKFYLELLLKELDIIQIKNRIVKTLSGGEKQRVSIARALINKPVLVLADEPTGNLDSKSSDEIVELLKKSNRDYKQTICLVLH